MMGISFNGKSQLSVNEPGTKICGCDVFSIRKHKNINPVRGDFQPLIADTQKFFPKILVLFPFLFPGKAVQNILRIGEQCYV